MKRKRAYNAGKPRLKIYQYDSKGKYLREYESQSDVFNKYFDGKKGDLFHNKEYRELPDGTYVSNYRIGRKGIQYWKRIYECPYCITYSTDKPFSVYNHLGKKIATFSSIRLFTELTGIDASTVTVSLNRGGKSTAHNGLYYKYDDGREG